MLEKNSLSLFWEIFTQDVEKLVNIRLWLHSQKGLNFLIDIKYQKVFKTPKSLAFQIQSILWKCTNFLKYWKMQRVTFEKIGAAIFKPNMYEQLHLFSTYFSIF